MGMCSDPLCLVLELADNGDLYHQLHGEDSDKKLSAQQKLSIAQDVARGISILHSYPKLIHRDIKSQNILV